MGSDPFKRLAEGLRRHRVLFACACILAGAAVVAVGLLARFATANLFWRSREASFFAEATRLGGTEDNTSTHMELPTITRLRAKWSNEDRVGMYLELGMGGGSGGAGVFLRHAYGRLLAVRRTPLP